MADLDDGFTRVANEILDEMAKRKLNSTQSSIVTFVIRHTYGFQRKSHDMSVGFISDGTGIHPDQIKRELKRLIEWRVIHVFEEATFTKARIIGINKDCKQWDAPSHREQSSSEGTNQSPHGEIATTEGTKQSSPPGDYSVPQKRYSFKENIKESIYTVFEHWNVKKITVHRELTQTMSSTVNARLKSYGLEPLLEAIDNYHTCLTGDEFYYSHKFTLKDFMNPKNLDRFLTENKPFENFRDKFKKPQAQPDEDDLRRRLEALDSEENRNT